jgi:CBS domain-containing protein
MYQQGDRNMPQPETVKTKAPPRNRIGELRALRDEIRVNIHLAGMDLRDEWHALEKRLPDPDRAAQQLKEITADVLDRFVTELQRFRSRLQGDGGAHSVARIMSRSPATCRPWDSLATAVSIMWDRDIGFLAVVDDAGKAIGVVTDRDACVAACTRGLRMDDIRVETVMSGPVCSCRPEDRVETVARLMGDKRVRRILVATEDGTLVGVVTLNDIARAILEETEPSARTGGLYQTVAALVRITASQPSGKSAPTA